MSVAIPFDHIPRDSKIKMRQTGCRTAAPAWLCPWRSIARWEKAARASWGSTGGRDESRPYNSWVFAGADGGHDVSCPYGPRGQSMETEGPEEVELTSARRAVTARARA